MVAEGGAHGGGPAGGPEGTGGVVRLRVVVRGSVQGVGFRWATEREAARLGLAGSVRNRIDGAVEAEVEGAAAGVDAMLAWLRHGPSSARVDGLESRAVEPRGERGFRIV
ncbi:acylphosphatase [Agrococcus sp. SL85]|uniref:acylphosphatase n=1 Tax=Agrococcus sp. SL85 TaxID=2995141 RepID=UPI00226CF88E|nr:acylphosphatase [Agrococcus sp. SL85]WAC65425.1 acylphosphatase [Agrococcus sp. SL85]